MNPETCRFFLVTAVIGAVSGASLYAKRVFQPPKDGALNAQGQPQKTPRHIQASWVNSVTETSAHMPFNRDGRSAQRRASLGNGGHGDHLIAVSVNEQNGGARDELVRKAVRPRQKPGETHNGSHTTLAARPGMEGHHAALTEADEGESAVVKRKRGKLGVKKGVKRGARSRNAAPSLPRVSKGKRKPLASSKRSGKRLGRVRRNESSFW
jgi:hypothetical protein